MTDSKSTVTRSAPMIAGIRLPYFLACLTVVLASTYLGLLTKDMIGALAASMVLGCALMWIGSNIRWFGAFGGGTLLCIGVPAILVHTGILPVSMKDVVAGWYGDSEFVGLLVAGIITGSLLGMDRRILVQVGARFAVPVLGGLLAAIGIGALAGLLLGFQIKDAVLFVILPIMGGGVSAGAVPMSDIYAHGLGGSAEQYLSMVVPVMIVANVLCIAAGGVYSALTRNRRQLFVGFNGNGEMLRAALDRPSFESSAEKPRPDYTSIGAGLLFSLCVFILGQIIGHFVPSIHPYAWLILLVAILKILGVVPRELEAAAEHWYQLIARTLVPAVLVWASFALIDINTLVEVVTSPARLALTLITVLVAALAAGFFGWLVRMYFVESSVSGGLCMADLGGSGDIATLGAADRMQLMPFAQMASRLGGAIVLLVASALLPLLT